MSEKKEKKYIMLTMMSGVQYAAQLRGRMTFDEHGFLNALRVTDESPFSVNKTAILFMEEATKEDTDIWVKRQIQLQDLQRSELEEAQRQREAREAMVEELKTAPILETV